MRFYYVNPANTNDITGPYFEGSRAVLPTGEVIPQLNAAAPGSGVYEAIEDNAICGNPDQSQITYYDRQVATAFEGLVGSAAARVRETVSCVQLPIADVYDQKRDDIWQQDQMVRYNAVFTSLNPNWWLIVTREQTDELLLIYSGAIRRELRGLNWPADANRPWVGIYNQSTGDARRYRISQAGADPTRSTTWDTLMDEWTDHTQATGNATDASRSALDASLAADNWQAVADHDRADPAWGYPPTVDDGELRAATA